MNPYDQYKTMKSKPKKSTNTTKSKLAHIYLNGTYNFDNLGYYILTKRKGVKRTSFFRWAHFLNSKLQQIGLTVMLINKNSYKISTVFTGIPIGLFETMVFCNGKSMDEHTEIYSTYATAVKGHKKVCDEIRKLSTDNKP